MNKKSNKASNFVKTPSKPSAITVSKSLFAAKPTETRSSSSLSSSKDRTNKKTFIIVYWLKENNYSITEIDSVKIKPGEKVVEESIYQIKFSTQYFKGQIKYIGNKNDYGERFDLMSDSFWPNKKSKSVKSLHYNTNQNEDTNKSSSK